MTDKSELLIVREVLHAHQRAMTPPDSGWGDMSYRKGSYDKLPVFQAALAAYRAAVAAPPTPEPDVMAEVVEALKLAVAVLEEADMRLDYAPDSLGALEMEDALTMGYAALAKIGGEHG